MLRSGCEAYRDTLWRLDTAEELFGGKSADKVLTVAGAEGGASAPVRALFVRKRAEIASHWSTATRASTAVDTPWGTPSAELADRFEELASAARTIADGMERNDDKAVARGRSALADTLAALGPRQQAAAHCYLSGDAATRGSLPAPVIQKGVQPYAKAISECYDAGRRREPGLRGKVVFRFAVARDGSVPWVAVEDSDMPDQDVVDCMVSELGRAVFPAPEKGGPASVVVPMTFGPGAPG